MNRSRQSYYKALKTVNKISSQTDQLMELVKPIRRLMPRMGGRKMYSMIQPVLAKKAVKIGRDRFFEWLREQDLLVKPKRAYVHTTQSNHRFWVYDNLTRDLTVARPNQLWVSDITYVRTLEGFCFLALVTDAFSRKIVGYDISDSLELEGCKRALHQAIQTASDLGQLIHHSDRGIQYCSHPYTKLLKESGVRISMAAKGDCYENALAERVNGILKDEFNLDATFKTKQLACQAAHQAIHIYNYHRPHWALDLQTPNERHAA